MAISESAPTTHGPELPPPAANTGAIGWIRQNLLSSPLNILLTLATLWLIWVCLPPFLNWAVFDANWVGTTRADCVKPGACWIMIHARFLQFIYGFYPEEQRWRVDLAFILLIAAVVPLLLDKMKNKRWFALFLFVIYPVVAFILFYGGLGLPVVETAKWGGLMLTMIVGIVAIVVSLPIGIVLALGRRSHMPVVRFLCIAFIEFVRGVPLITVLFMSSVMLPLFLPTGISLDKLMRALVGYSLFAAAYLAEVVRGGLQAMPKGQYEGAMSLGLNYWKMMIFVILPQALRIVIPSIVNEFIGLFKDTTLVLIIGIYDFLNIVQTATRDGQWLGLAKEGYVFAAIVYFVICFGMSRYSIALEKKLQTGYRR